jgi:hypothetical protein
MVTVDNKSAKLCVHCHSHEWEKGFLLCKKCNTKWNNYRSAARAEKESIGKSLDKWWKWVGTVQRDRPQHRERQGLKEWYGGGWRDGDEGE